MSTRQHVDFKHIHCPGGTGKTFVYNALTSKAHCGQEKALCRTRPVFRQFIEFLAHPHASPTPYHIPFQFSPIFYFPCWNMLVRKLRNCSHSFVYVYAGFRTQPVKNVKHWQLPVPQILGFSRTSHANPGDMYIHGKLRTRRTRL